MVTNELLRGVIFDGLLAAVAAIGFAVISNPSWKAVFVSALLSAIGHSLRYFLMKSGIEISVATFVAATTIGLLSVLFARLIHCPAEVFSFPSLLPMIPGMFAYKAILSAMKFMQSTHHEMDKFYMMDFFRNGMTTVFIMLALVIGVSLPVLLFPRTSFSVTRKY
ncbi:MAG: threonine/serine exporter family protein [Paludibacter sp.]|nr:threonine/serine exporter family protein [Paludibacter sp.]